MKITDELRNIRLQHDLWLALTENTERCSAAAWKAAAEEITGRKARSGKDARAMILNELSDKLLLDARVEQVKGQFKK